MKSSPSLPPNDERCGRYQLLRRVGMGGLGEIFLARDSTREAPNVALKRLLPEIAKDPLFVDMFIDEQRVASRLRHPNIVAVLECGESGGRHYLVLEWIDGVTVRELLERSSSKGTTFPLDFVVRIIHDVAEALDYAHERAVDRRGHPLHVVHRDVSPPNIMLACDGAVKLLDFGMAKARTQIRKTHPGLVKGKFGYLAPEQLTGMVDGRTDVFALGLCFFELLTGNAVFGQRSAAETVTAIQEYQGPPDIQLLRSEIPAALVQVLQHSLAPRPAARFPNARSLRDALLNAFPGPLAEPERLAQIVGDLFPERLELQGGLESRPGMLRRSWQHVWGRKSRP